jgi:hypothetical protein
MRIPSVGWAFFGLVLIVLVGYVLDRGILVGSYVNPHYFQTVGTEKLYVYFKKCRYLHFGGVHDVEIIGETEADASSKVCQMFDNQWPPGRTDREAH